MVLRFAGHAALRLALSGRDVHLTPENRVHPARSRMIVEDDRREHVSMLRHSHGRHLLRHRLVEHFVDPARAVEKGEFGVQVQVNEFRHDEF